MDILAQYKVPRDEDNPAFVKSFAVDQEAEFKGNV